MEEALEQDPKLCAASTSREILDAPLGAYQGMFACSLAAPCYKKGADVPVRRKILCRLDRLSAVETAQ